MPNPIFRKNHGPAKTQPKPKVKPEKPKVTSAKDKTQTINQTQGEENG